MVAVSGIDVYPFQTRDYVTDGGTTLTDEFVISQSKNQDRTLPARGTHFPCRMVAAASDFDVVTQFARISRRRRPHALMSCAALGKCIVIAYNRVDLPGSTG